MDKRQWIGAVSLSVAVFALWLAWVTWYEKKHPPVIVPPVAATTEPAPTDTNPAIATTQSTTGPATQTVVTAITGMTAVESTDTASANIVLGSGEKNDAGYSLQIELTPIGAGVDHVTLNQFDSPASATAPKEKKQRYVFETPLQHAAVVTAEDAASAQRELAETRVLATRVITINHKEIDLSTKRWSIAPSSTDSAQFYIYIDDANGHVAKVTKTYRIEKKGAGGSVGYEVGVTQEIADARPAGTGAPLSVHSIINGPTPPPGEGEQGIDRAVVTGYVEGKSNIAVEPSLLSEFKPDDSLPAHVAGTIDQAPVKEPAHTIYTRPMGWIGQSSSYFAAIVLPANPGAPDFSARVIAVAGTTADEHLAAISFDTADQMISANGSATTSMTVYFGPKWRDVLDTDHYLKFPRMYNKLLEIKSKMCGWATSDSLIAGLVWILRMFHHVFKDWGVSIICLVLIVRTLLHPITKRSQVQMMKMGKLTPEVEKLKKKYADQPDVLNREMMKLYKQQGGAILGCLPMFLQTPIWIALWSALQGTFELRHAPFLQVYGHSLTWIHDLARPDTLIDLKRWFGAEGIPLLLFGWHLRAINLLPLLMAVVTFVNQKYFMPMPIAATPEQEQQQKMQRGMSLFFPLMFYTMPSGLNLYYLTSMSLGIVESKIIRDHIKEQEELAKAEGPELVSVKASRASRRGNDSSQDNKTPEKPGLMARMMDAMQKAQEQAEEMRKKNDKDKGKGKDRGK